MMLVSFINRQKGTRIHGHYKYTNQQNKHHYKTMLLAKDGLSHCIHNA